MPPVLKLSANTQRAWFSTSVLAPASRRSLTASALPRAAARCRAVAPSSADVSGRNTGGSDSDAAAGARSRLTVTAEDT